MGHFKSLWKSVIDKHAPLIKKRVRGRESPWFTNEIKIKAQERDYYLRKARRTNKEIVGQRIAALEMM